MLRLATSTPPFRSAFAMSSNWRSTLARPKSEAGRYGWSPLASGIAYISRSAPGATPRKPRWRKSGSKPKKSAPTTLATAVPCEVSVPVSSSAERRKSSVTLPVNTGCRRSIPESTNPTVTPVPGAVPAPSASSTLANAWAALIASSPHWFWNARVLRIGGGILLPQPLEFRFQHAAELGGLKTRGGRGRRPGRGRNRRRCSRPRRRVKGRPAAGTASVVRSRTSPAK